ncbi:MAG: hypothetical protein ABIQ97_04750 [Lysobacteraceae bacterium]
MIPKDPSRAIALARSSDTSPDVLASLTLSPLAFVREAAISNLSTPFSSIAKVAPCALNSEAEIGIARSIASRRDVPPSLLEQLIALLSPLHLDGSRRENWPHEQLAVALLSHPNLPGSAATAFFKAVKVSKSVKSAVLHPHQEQRRNRTSG